ncbi:uncharacterized protein UHOD_11212 [Ustilago sp. UG-2017b]|nr:uncharacterized protein UHOD_11212 [Ustilago sp. UG-2017b]
MRASFSTSTISSLFAISLGTLFYLFSHTPFVHHFLDHLCSVHFSHATANPDDVNSPIPFTRLTEEEIENMDRRTMRGMLMAMSRQVDKPDIYKRPSKRDDFLGQLRWFTTTIGVAPKLNNKNWHVWNPLFLDTIDTWSDALRHLEGKVNLVTTSPTESLMATSK